MQLEEEVQKLQFAGQDLQIPFSKKYLMEQVEHKSVVD